MESKKLNSLQKFASFDALLYLQFIKSSFTSCFEIGKQQRPLCVFVIPKLLIEVSLYGLISKIIFSKKSLSVHMFIRPFLCLSCPEKRVSETDIFTKESCKIRHK